MEIGLLVEPRLLSGVKLFLDVLEIEEQVRKLVWEMIFCRGFPLKCWAVTCSQLPITSQAQCFGWALRRRTPH